MGDASSGVRSVGSPHRGEGSASVKGCVMCRRRVDLSPWGPEARNSRLSLKLCKKSVKTTGQSSGRRMTNAMW